MKELIDELSYDLAECHVDYLDDAKLYTDYDTMAQKLISRGYRRQSEVIEEYRKKVYSKMEKYTVFGREYIQRIMREAEKEMKGGAE